jgi:hypothetical protein
MFWSHKREPLLASKALSLCLIKLLSHFLGQYEKGYFSISTIFIFLESYIYHVLFEWHHSNLELYNNIFVKTNIAFETHYELNITSLASNTIPTHQKVFKIMFSGHSNYICSSSGSFHIIIIIIIFKKKK